jgi:cardiolipin synthase
LLERHSIVSRGSGIYLLFPFLFLLTLLSGCALPKGGHTSSGKSGIGYQWQTLQTGNTLTVTPPIAKSGHILSDKYLNLKYSDNKQMVEKVLTLPSQRRPIAEKTTPFSRSYKPPIIVLTAEAEEQTINSDKREEVLVRPVSDWQLLIQGLVKKITPSDPGEGVVLDVLQESEILLYYNDSGELISVPIDYKPPEVKPVRTLSLVELLVDAMQTTHQLMDLQRTDERYVLFNTGDVATYGFPFVLMDIDKQTIVFIQRDIVSNPMVAQGPVGFLQAIFHTITSQVRSLLGQPVSSIGRLFTTIGTGVVDTLHPSPNWVEDDDPVPPVDSTAEAMDTKAWEAHLDQITGTTSTHGQIRFLVDGENFFPELIHAINNAKHSIRMRLYIFDNDDYALKLADLLRRRSSEIKIEILLDGFGTITGGMADPEHTPGHHKESPFSMVQYLRTDSDIKVRVVPNIWLQGDHTKSIIIDDSKAYLGGMNIGREYRYEWHDLMLELSGAVTTALLRDFNAAWSHAGILGDLGALFPRSTPESTQSSPQDYPIRVLHTKPGNSQILTSQIAAIRQARQRIWIQNAYISSDAILYELVKARRRGVDVRVIMPYRSDTGIMDRSNALAANTILKHGVRVYIYPHMSHIKAAVYDDWICLGSANFDRLSLRINKELNVATSHPAATRELVEKIFLPDFERSVELMQPFPEYWSDYLLELLADHL